MKFGLLAIFLACFLLGPTAQGQDRTLSFCSGGINQPVGNTVEEVVGQSTDVVVATIQEFIPSNEPYPPFGYYRLEVISVKKGDRAIGPIEVFGVEPYQHVPAHYIDATLRHERQGNKYNPTSGPIAIIEKGDCRLAFKGLGGYAYILFFRDNALWSFDVITDLQQDQLLQHVENASQ